MRDSEIVSLSAAWQADRCEAGCSPFMHMHPRSRLTLGVLVFKSKRVLFHGDGAFGSQGAYHHHSASLEHHCVPVVRRQHAKTIYGKMVYSSVVTGVRMLNAKDNAGMRVGEASNPDPPTPRRIRVKRPQSTPPPTAAQGSSKPGWLNS